MKSRNFLIPDGIEYYIGADAIKFDKLKSNILKIFSKYGCTYIVPPIFDSLENLLNLNSSDLDSKTGYILDRSTGNEIGVRADITPQISKVDYQITNGSGNSKFSYMGDILRLSPGPFDRANPFQSGVEYFGNITKKVDIEIIKLMIDVKNIIENLSIDYWIEGGTLLGAIREKKLIPWDHDIDMGMINYSNDAIKKMIHNLKKKFYVSVKTFNNMEGVWDLGEYRVIKVYPKKYFFLKDELCLDIFIYYKGNVPNVKNEVYKYVVWGKNAFHKKEFFDNLEKIEFYGESISVPSNYREFLKVKYGNDWETPKKKWNVAIDDGSIIKS